MEPIGNVICQVYKGCIGEKSTNVTKKSVVAHFYRPQLMVRKKVLNQGSLVFMEIEQF